MCEHGDTLILSLPGRKQHGPCEIDRCIAPLVQALNAAGFFTKASCCGHGHRPGSIILRDDRELIIAADWKEARRIDKLWPMDIHGATRRETEG